MQFVAAILIALAAGATGADEAPSAPGDEALPELPTSSADAGTAAGSAAAPDASTADVAPQLPAEQSTPAQETILVLEPNGEGSRELRRLVASVLTAELTKLTSMAVLSSADVKRLAELEADKQSAGCEDSGCVAEIAGALGARYVVFGEVATIGGLSVITLNLFDVASARAIKRVSLDVDTPEELPARVRGAAPQLVPDAAPAALDAAPPARPWGWLAVGVGAVAVAGGVCFDVFSPTSNNRTVDPFDFVGPGIVALGLGAVGVGIAAQVLE